MEHVEILLKSCIKDSKHKLTLLNHSINSPQVIKAKTMHNDIISQCEIALRLVKRHRGNNVRNKLLM